MPREITVTRTPIFTVALYQLKHTLRNLVQCLPNLTASIHREGVSYTVYSQSFLILRLLINYNIIRMESQLCTTYNQSWVKHLLNCENSAIYLGFSLLRSSFYPLYERTSLQRTVYVLYFIIYIVSLITSEKLTDVNNAKNPFTFNFVKILQIEKCEYKFTSNTK